MFIGELIPGEQYETHDGHILTVQTVNQFYCGVWKQKRDSIDGAVFTIITTTNMRKSIKDII